MAWGARQHDDGTWRLCERKGRTILFVNSKQFPDLQIQWSSRSGAEKCAKELNETYWSAYDRAQKKDVAMAGDVFWGILDTIRKHAGISDKDWKEING
jgi:hypothetical protein